MSLYAAYAFNEGGGSTIFDYSGNSRNMTISGTNTWVTGHGSYTSAFAPGSSSAGAVYDAGSAQSALSGDVTLMGWYMHTSPTSTLASHVGGAYSAIGTTARLALWSYRSLSGTAASPEFTVRDSAAALFSIGVNGTVADPNVWHHAAMVYHSSGLMETYLDGSLVASSSPTSNPIGTTVRYLGVGSVTSGTTTQSTVQDLRMFSSALTSTDITTYMNTPVVAPAATGPSLMMTSFP